MNEAEQLQWFIDWRNRLLSAMRLWWKPSDYKAACRAWTTITEILKEQPPILTHREQTHGTTWTKA